MAILKVAERPSRDFAEDEKGIVSGTRRWSILTDGLNDSPLDIYAAVGVEKYDEHPVYPQAIARTPKLQQREIDGVVWDMQVFYSSAPFDASSQPDEAEQQEPSDENNQLKPPELRPAVWSFSRKEFMRVLERDAITDVPVVNSAGFPYDPPIEVPSSNMLIRVDFWLPNINIAAFRLLWDRVNSAAWKNFPARTLRINDANAKSQFDKAEGGGLLAYWNCSVEIEHSEKPWNPKKILDWGSMERISQGGAERFMQIRDDAGNPIVAPLNGSGRRLNPGEALFYRDVNAYKESAFADVLFA
jgi:hypothetical protein